MRIEGNSGNVPANPVQQRQVSANGGGGTRSGPVGDSGSSSHVRSAELQKLLDQVKQPEAGSGANLQQIKQRIATGHYLTPDAATKTAEAMLKSQD